MLHSKVAEFKEEKKNYKIIFLYSMNWKVNSNVTFKYMWQAYVILFSN